MNLCMHNKFAKLTFQLTEKLIFWQNYGLAFLLILVSQSRRKILRVSRTTPKRGGSLTKKMI